MNTIVLSNPLFSLSHLSVCLTVGILSPGSPYPHKALLCPVLTVHLWAEFTAGSQEEKSRWAKEQVAHKLTTARTRWGICLRYLHVYRCWPLLMSTRYWDYRPKSHPSLNLWSLNPFLKFYPTCLILILPKYLYLSIFYGLIPLT